MSSDAPDNREDSVVQTCDRTDATGGLQKGQQEPLGGIEKVLMATNDIEAQCEKRQHEQEDGKALDEAEREGEEGSAVGVVTFLACGLHLSS